ncbi:MAG: hypothetical protein Q4P25_01855, partial [Tissierellia bacterium]|nr:hypothetical protein [Tissierellia bacterium]
MVNCRRKVWIILLLLLLIIGRGRILAKEEMTAELMTIEELKQQEEYTVARLRGWITAKASDVFMEDSTGGIELLFTNFKNRRYLVGSQVEVQGKLRWKPKNNVGYLSIDGEENFKTLGKRISVSPMKIDPSEIEKELGRFVSIQNIKILEEGTEIRKLAQSGDVKFYIYDMRKNGKLPLEVGDHIDEIQGIASDRGNFPHLCIRVLKDIGKITKPQSPIEPDEPEEKPIDP